MADITKFFFVVSMGEAGPNVTTKSAYAVGHAFAWHVFPIDTTKYTPVPSDWEWDRGRSFVLTSYGVNGMIVLTKNNIPPKVPEGWMVIKPAFSEGWHFTDQRWKWTILKDCGEGCYAFAAVEV